MNKDSRNQKNHEDVNSYGIKKNTYWEIYGVKSFRYRGKRKYTPLLYPSFDGGMKISNDVFGLTISQFERMYKACLERMKTKEQWILNLRYPDKSSTEYLEYLENCTDCLKDQLLFIESDPREKYLYEHLVKTIGTEIDIRKRQRLFIIQDMVANACMSDHTKISSGSLAEGLNLPDSDINIMYVNNSYEVRKSLSNTKHQIHRTTLVMDVDIGHPGFTRLRFKALGVGVILSVHCQCRPGTCTGKRLYLSANDFLNTYYNNYNYNRQIYIHGPCLSDKNQILDIAFCLQGKYLPQNAISLAFRRRLQWPPDCVIDSIIKYKCLLVPIGPKTKPDDHLLWRLSFSVAEKKLEHSFNFTQLLCYGLLKIMLKRIVNTQNDVKDLLCSYFLKTALFWVADEVDIDTCQLSKIYYCFSLCLNKIISLVNTCYCPNYFIPEQNMFLGKINRCNNKILLCVLESIKFGGMDGLIRNLFPPDKDYYRLPSTENDSSFIMSDFLLYKLRDGLQDMTLLQIGISSYFKGLVISDSLLKSETSTFIADSCNIILLE
ncbi:Hypothetical predicted protein [Mytilus galloprovincialis]|uniref:Mab-21-like HhH/H2TH-like domain-containing protein n=1 Tax=Mytilus galloprovincialis TaxID=29158 RepID=A0A8B6GC81_MYTGA|nr:Hypothetical predicted protein [Mytilus galloprovincialis]